MHNLGKLHWNPIGYLTTADCSFELYQIAKDHCGMTSLAKTRWKSVIGLVEVLL
jgi:hypothetical protein